MQCCNHGGWVCGARAQRLVLEHAAHLLPSRCPYPVRSAVGDPARLHASLARWLIAVSGPRLALLQMNERIRYLLPHHPRVRACAGRPRSRARCAASLSATADCPQAFSSPHGKSWGAPQPATPHPAARPRAGQSSAKDTPALAGQTREGQAPTGGREREQERARAGAQERARECARVGARTRPLWVTKTTLVPSPPLPPSALLALTASCQSETGLA